MGVDNWRVAVGSRIKFFKKLQVILKRLNCLHLKGFVVENLNLTRHLIHFLFTLTLILNIFVQYENTFLQRNVNEWLQVAPGVDLQSVLMSAAQKAIMRNLATHVGSLTFFMPTAKATAGQQKMPKKPKILEASASGDYTSLFVSLRTKC